MGGVLSTPKPKVPEVKEVTNPDDERKKLQERQRRGMESTIKTSYNGLLNGKELNRKKLLGE